MMERAMMKRAHLNDNIVIFVTSAFSFRPKLPCH